MSINGLSNNSTVIAPMQTIFAIKDLNEGMSLQTVNKNGRYDTVELSISAEDAEPNGQSSKAIISVAFDEVRGKYIDGKYIAAKYEVTAENFFEKMTAITKEPQTEETEKAIMGYIQSFEYKVGFGLGSSENLFSSLNDMAIEMMENQKNGIENTLENINTKFNVEGAEFSFEELLNVNTAMKKLDEFYDAGSFDYQAVAREAVVNAYLNRDDIGFNEEQRNAMQSMFEKKVDRFKSWEQKNISELEINGEGNTVTELSGYFYGRANNYVADESLVNEIKNIFAGALTEADFEKSLKEYGEAMKPLYEITEKLSLPYSSNYQNYVEKQTAKDASELLSFWKGHLY